MIFIISTMNEKFSPRDSNLPKKMCVVINQGKSTGLYENEGYAGVIYDAGIGLSRSRNLGLDFCSKNSFQLPWIISDDDVVYFDSAIDKLMSDRKLLFTGINVGQIKCPDGTDFKNYNSSFGLVKHVWNFFGISSVEIIINDKRTSKVVRFDENFGLGSSNPFGGEELLYLVNWKAQRSDVFRINLYLGCHPKESTGSQTDTIGYWITRKNLFKKLFPQIWPLIYFAFKVKKKFNKRSIVHMLQKRINK